MNKTILFKIDGQPTHGIPTEREQFLEFFNKLETLMYSDDRKYWVLYDEVNPETPFCKEYFWCIPTEEIDFIRVDGQWYYHKNPVEDVLGRITLDEEPSPVGVSECNEYKRLLLMFNRFETNLANYLLGDSRADEHTFKLWKMVEHEISRAQTSDVADDNKVCLMTWLEQNWGAWLRCVLDGSYNYMNVTSIVLGSWKEFCEVE